jgi:hypothetical protein
MLVAYPILFAGILQRTLFHHFWDRGEFVDCLFVV